MFLSVFLLSVLALPLFALWPHALYFSIDPDLHYVASALTFADHFRVYYDLHPGAPVCILLGILLLPFRLAALISSESFEFWSFHHIDQIVFYLRLLQPFGTVAGLILIGWAVWRATKNWLWAVVGVLCVLQLSIYPTITWYINNENWHIIAVGLWLLTLVWVLESVASESQFRQTSLFAIWGGMVGLSLVAKFTTLPLVAASVFFVFELVLRKKLGTRQVLAFVGAAILGFALFRLPVENSGLKDWVWNLLTHSGNYGSGPSGAINPSQYIASLNSLWTRDPFAICWVIVCLAATFWRRKLTSIALGALVVSIAFLKYDQTKYQLTAYIVISFCGILSLAQIVEQRGNKNSPAARVAPWVLMAGMASLFFIHFESQFERFNTSMVARAESLDRYLSNTPHEPSVWEYGWSRDYSYLYVRNWGGGFWSSIIEKERPDLADLTAPYFQLVNTPNGKKLPLFEHCWRRLYIQDEVLPQFLAEAKRHFEIQSIVGSQMSVLTSDHCPEP